MALDVRDERVVQPVSADGSRTPRSRYLPIAEHSLVGDLHTVALVGTDGTIDWYGCPRFDSPSVFAAILDADRGGLFRSSGLICGPCKTAPIRGSERLQGLP